ncbi:MAG: hypothetical protein JWO15_2464 [Sphingomonadales bacterium]|nr:hypothetical protein [Sphingomonadales bacterium]
MENENSQTQASTTDFDTREPFAPPGDQGAASTSTSEGPGAPGLTAQIKDKAVAAVAEQKDGLADRIDDLAKTVHNSGDQFAGRQDWVASAIERGATELGSLATSLRQNDLSSLLSQVTSLARKQPALFVGASLVAGFAVARLGKIVVSDVSRDDLPTLPEVGHASS